MYKTVLLFSGPDRHINELLGAVWAPYAWAGPRGFDLIKLPYLLDVNGQTGRGNNVDSEQTPQDWVYTVCSGLFFPRGGRGRGG